MLPRWRSAFWMPLLQCEEDCIGISPIQGHLYKRRSSNSTKYARTVSSEDLASLATYLNISVSSALADLTVGSALASLNGKPFDL